MPGLNVQLRSTGFSYDAWIEEKETQSNDNDLNNKKDITRKFHRVDIELKGANTDAVLVAEKSLTEVINVINEQGAFENIRSYSTVTYRNIYPGIDLEFVARKGSDKPVEYNFIVHPGADASQIKLKYNSGSDISLKNGMIEMNLSFGVLKEKIPASYTEQDGKALAVRYKAEDELKNIYAFHVPDYDKKKTLVIDPTPSLVWASYYGGTAGDRIESIDVDAAGDIYVGGISASGNNIATAGTFQSALSGGDDFFIAKFTTAGVRLWGTYVGGTSTETNPLLRVSGSFIYLTGMTLSAGMGTAGTHRPDNAGGYDAYIASSIHQMVPGYGPPILAALC